VAYDQQLTSSVDQHTAADSKMVDTIRLASYNIAMYGDTSDEVQTRLSASSLDNQYQKIASVIKIVKPDILVLMEMDYHPENKILQLFHDNYLAKAIDSNDPIDYPYLYQIKSNTGLLSNVDINQDGEISLPNDAYGFGRYEGQYASAILSKYPIDLTFKRSFQQLLWRDMPDALLPVNADGTSFYTPEVLDEFRLSSKNHIDVPIMLSADQTIHALISHPTPPVFDGPEDKNGKRNYDEIRIWADYLSGADYLIDDNGVQGGLSGKESFVIFGDLNADPNDGDSYQGAMNQLIEHPRINQEVALGSKIPSSNGGKSNNQKSGHVGDPAYDTSFFGLRIDYVLPSADIDVVDSGVFWPDQEEKYADLVAKKAASDHLLVWVDLLVE
jgi:endonuclease/exonuclease/phosphatase family metal-dependent hydrolase